MRSERFPTIDTEGLTGTRDALHAYARILGNGLKACRPKRKHWWHASLRPSLSGLTTRVVHANVDFELELNLRESRLEGRAAGGSRWDQALRGQPASKLSAGIQAFLADAGIDAPFVSASSGADAASFAAYSPEQAQCIARAISAVAGTLATLRAGIREETSPIQLWPHHFDVSMLWLPGGTIPGQDPQDEENADPQMNFGFTLGDQSIADPYFYITAYPLPDALPMVALPAGAVWESEAFEGVVLPYRALLEAPDPERFLLDLWTAVLAAGREHMTSSG